jgi:hypothetical protein
LGYEIEFYNKYKTRHNLTKCGAGVGKQLREKVKRAMLPKCQLCGESAEVVYENEYWTYTFDEKTERGETYDKTENV